MNYTCNQCQNSKEQGGVVNLCPIDAAYEILEFLIHLPFPISKVSDPVNEWPQDLVWVERCDHNTLRVCAFIRRYPLN